jgi:hypothetical protein
MVILLLNKVIMARLLLKDHLLGNMERLLDNTSNTVRLVSDKLLFRYPLDS